MTKIKKIWLQKEDIHKLEKYGFLRVGNFAISLTDKPINQVKIYGNANY